ncbi:hypothetical protein NLJ89_g4897 [Agrocybe chaxingu]|uniref:Uncharacterized protein n=1 Tax=Agrocybe chaxingu TaxID=84603 RepID=A0A9W8K1P7_9AGAR|nr:hypothetical protein NLJ89_g4897 [Agrocybe chaxingu]
MSAKTSHGLPNAVSATFLTPEILQNILEEVAADPDPRLSMRMINNCRTVARAFRDRATKVMFYHLRVVDKEVMINKRLWFIAVHQRAMLNEIRKLHVILVQEAGLQQATAGILDWVFKRMSSNITSIHLSYEPTDPKVALSFSRLVADYMNVAVGLKKACRVDGFQHLILEDMREIEGNFFGSQCQYLKNLTLERCSFLPCRSQALYSPNAETFCGLETLRVVEALSNRAIKFSETIPYMESRPSVNLRSVSWMVQSRNGAADMWTKLAVLGNAHMLEEFEVIDLVRDGASAGGALNEVIDLVWLKDSLRTFSLKIIITNPTVPLSRNNSFNILNISPLDGVSYIKDLHITIETFYDYKDLTSFFTSRRTGWAKFKSETLRQHDSYPWLNALNIELRLKTHADLDEPSDAEIEEFDEDLDFRFLEEKGVVGDLKVVY